MTATIESASEIVGLQIAAPRRHPVVIALRTAALLCLAVALVVAGRRYGLPMAMVAVLLCALAVQLVYLSRTPFFERTYDVLGHLQHIAYVATRHALPPTAECWECYQPGLSYLVAAAVYGGSFATGWFDPITALRLLSLAWYWVFLIAGVGTIRRWTAGDHQATIATALLALWPAGVLHSSRISNDLPAYAWFAVGTYLTLRWWQEARPRDLVLAGLVAGAGLLVKATLLILCGTLGALILIDIWRRRAVPLPSMLALLTMGAGLGGYVAMTLAKGGGFTGPGLPHADMLVGNSWSGYLLLDVRSYLTSPFVSSVVPGGGREFFWNYVLKSSMFGDYHWFHGALQRALAIVMAPVLLGLVVLFGIGLVRSLKAPLKAMPLLLVIGLSFLALFLYRFAHPYSCNNDVRFIYPAVLPIALIVTDGAGTSRAAVLLIATFCVLSAAFYFSV